MNALTWFEIPATDFERACQFYEKLLDIQLQREIFGGSQPNGIFPYENGVGGAVAHVPYAQPGANGSVIYLNAQTEARIDQALARLEGLGGRVALGKTDLGPTGHIALIIDTEGNRVGLHAMAAG